MDIFAGIRHALTAPNRGTPEHLVESLRRYRAERQHARAVDSGAHPRIVERLQDQAYGPVNQAK